MGFCTTIDARRRREQINEQLRKNREKTQELLKARRKALGLPDKKEDEPPCNSG